MYLYHFFEKERGPFLSLSDLPDDEVQNLLSQYRKENAASGKKPLSVMFTAMIILSYADGRKT
jgi:transcription initiation factor TFIIIB Brf1 subunit/transcription initiation factor TFIIB